MALSGLYSADYYRKAVHKIKVDDNVKEVLVGPDTFEVSKKSKFSKIVNTTGKRTINLDLEEHVFVKNTGTLYLDHHGKRLKNYRMHWIANSWKAMAPKSWQQRKQKNMKFLKLMQ